MEANVVYLLIPLREGIREAFEKDFPQLCWSNAIDVLPFIRSDFNEIDAVCTRHNFVKGADYEIERG